MTDDEAALRPPLYLQHLYDKMVEEDEVNGMAMPPKFGMDVKQMPSIVAARKIDLEGLFYVCHSSDIYVLCEHNSDVGSLKNRFYLANYLLIIACWTVLSFLSKIFRVFCCGKILITRTLIVRAKNAI